jgi:lipid-A-disaccharide synthase
MRYYIIAGERSGDLHGGNLITAIKKHDTGAVFRGFGGEYMQQAGADLVVHYEKMAFMGFVEVVRNLGTISQYIRKCKSDIISFNADVIILIDYAGFNLRIAQFAKRRNLKVFYYISPKVWAWYQKRALKLKANVDRMFVILPFEKDFFSRFNWDVDYVGNPVLDAVKAHRPDLNFKSKYALPGSRPIVALLPGSRKQELKWMIPVLTEVVKRFPDHSFAVASVSNLNQELYKPLSDLPNVVTILEDTYNLLLNAQAAIVTSGTATLETALFKVPQTVIYKTSASTYRIVKWMIKVPFISLVNLIAGKEVIRELIQSKANREDIGCELNALLNEQSYRAQILREYDSIYKKLDTGSASENTARLMVGYLKNSD